MEISKTYSPSEIEKKWYEFWEKGKYFTPEIDKSQNPYTVLMPPPNVTGILHMGHVLNNTLQDIAVRYKRMTGVPTLWLPGMDHAGIATQNVVEKELAGEGLDRHQVGREELVERIWKWKEEKGGTIIEQLKLLGTSCDWTRECFTLDEKLSRAVKEVFVSLYNKGLIYKGRYIINWCPRCVSALSNDEVDHYDEKGKLWYIKYPLKKEHRGNGEEITHLTVATTRPETMLGDTAVAVNPGDERFAHLAGRKIILPFVDREIPVILDDYVDKDFGTGVVKVTPAHDPNDFEMGQRHHLPSIVVMDEQGVMNKEAGDEFEGLDRTECREKLINMLKEKGLLADTEEHQLAIGRCYRCDSIVEPYLSPQWFVKMKPLSVKAIEAVEKGEIVLQPERWQKVFMHWMNNIRDWCISRQIWWGHRIPVYYCRDCSEEIVSTEEPEQCPQCASSNLDQDEDVLDTWFSSWLWPFSTMGWPDKTEDLQYFLPTDLLITAPEIIYLWVARMIMATYEFCGCKPFHTVLLHGTVRDNLGRKMSKSLGNSPNPITIIKDYGADALRFSMVFNTPKGADIYYTEGVLENGRNFCNKIWNAYRYIMINAQQVLKQEGDTGRLPQTLREKLSGDSTELADKWIYSRLNEVIAEVRDYYESLRFNDAAQLLQDFIWKEFCSWYLELSKERIYDSQQNEGRAVAVYILLDVLQQSMRLLHPLMPFISEEIWQNIKNIAPGVVSMSGEEALITASFPQSDKSLINSEAKEQMRVIRDSITTIRNLRKQVNIPPGKEADVIISIPDNKIINKLETYRNYFQKLAKVRNLKLQQHKGRPEGCIATVMGNLEIYLQLTGVIDIEKEKQRLQKILTKTGKELDRTNKKLANPNFLEKAKAEVVQKEREKKEELKLTFDKTEQLLKDISGL